MWNSTEVSPLLNPRKTVRIGYVGSGFPLFHEPFDGILAGIHKELWETALRGYEIRWEKREVYGSYEPDENGFFDGMLGEMQNGTLDIALQVVDFSYRRARMAALYYTLPIEEAEENFYESKEIFFEPSIVVIPFTAHFTAILIALVLAMKLTEAAVRAVIERFGGREGSFWMSSNSLTLLGALFHRLAIIFVLIIYNAAFVGLATSPGVEPIRFHTPCYVLVMEICNMESRKLEAVMPLLRQGKMTLVVNYEGTIKDTMKHELFGDDPTGDSRRYRIIGDMEEKHKLLCHNPSAIYFGRIYSITHNDPQKIYKPQCAFKVIDSTNLAFLPPSCELIKRRIGRKRLSTFYMSRLTVPRKIRKRFSYVQLRVFDRDMTDTFWWRRLTNRPRFDHEKPQIYWFQPIGLTAFETIFIIFGALLLFSFLVFILEIVYARLFKRTHPGVRNAYKFMNYVF
ncbi:hypothetical protein PRIPAC_94542 [Pristionchus pacificus]|uniref:Uncharacterized protein n=1 Tax=Pristionchus pacificus TaxID=54126 RepID=A0A2A6BP62_PRIPA|nr:hypothetical protein PRIPAC_94542 [Pristionchus pacificus]|eukprot:PDM67628.1 hypothetical protein PRIPAC_45672 [Pristionchus pacificus]